MWKHWRSSQQVTIIHRISREHYAMHATSLFIDRSGVSHAHVECAPCMGLSQRVGKVIFPGGQQWGNFISPTLKPRKKLFYKKVHSKQQQISKSKDGQGFSSSDTCGSHWLSLICLDMFRVFPGWFPASVKFACEEAERQPRSQSGNCSPESFKNMFSCLVKVTVTLPLPRKYQLVADLRVDVYILSW